MLVLSLFPGIGLLDMAFELEGFCVVRGPDLLWGGDVHKFHPPSGRFDGIIGGPPCQAFSQMARMARFGEAQGRTSPPNLIPEYERVVGEAEPTWFLMENVPAAPLPSVSGYVVTDHLLDNRKNCGGDQRRLRRFSFGSRDGRPLALEWWLPPVSVVCLPTATCHAVRWDRARKRATGDHSEAGFRRVRHAQGLPDDWTLPAFRVEEKIRAVGNGVPLPMGQIVARAVKRAMGIT